MALWSAGMRTHHGLSLLAGSLVLSACGGVVVESGHEIADTGPSITDVSWLIGSWETSPDEHGCTYREEWHQETPMLLTGQSRETCNPPLTEREPYDEALRMEAEANGLVYVAWPTGQDRTEFPLTAGSTTGFVAENPDHDFPNRIEYRRTAAGIDAIVSGPTRNFTLSMHPATAGDD